MGSLSLETSMTLAVLGTVSIGSIVLLLMQTVKQLFPSVEGQLAIRLTFLASLTAALIAFGQAEVDWTDPWIYTILFLSTCGVFIAAVAQYAFLFKRSVEGLPPPADAQAPAEAFNSPTEETGEYPVMVRRMHDEKVR